jgi:inward rectifier potassium channel
VEAEVRPDREEPPRDLGFGSVVARESRKRLLNPDGTFNVGRRGLGVLESLSPYHALLSITWPRFLLGVAASYLLLNALFALLYLACGAGALAGAAPGFAPAFFFSVETFSTIGYGNMVPAGLPANLVMTLEALVGLLWLALSTGIVFARFSRPTARIIFSRSAIVAPYRGITALEFRIANARSSQLFDVSATVLLAIFEDGAGKPIRRFHALPLERNRVVFFPLSWTVVHPIDEASPMHGLTAQDLLAKDAEVLILLSAIDEASSQPVYARTSYKAHEIAWNARFSDVFDHPKDGRPLTIDLGRLHDIEPPE